MDAGGIKCDDNAATPYYGEPDCSFILGKNNMNVGIDSGEKNYGASLTKKERSDLKLTSLSQRQYRVH